MLTCMKYVGRVEVAFAFEVPGDDPGDSHGQRVADTGAAAAEVAAAVRDKIVPDDVAQWLTRFGQCSVESSVDPQEGV